MNKADFKADYERHRNIATQVEALYIEIRQLTLKKPTERVTPLIAKKINHVLAAVKDQISEDEFLDAVETLPTDGELNRYDEASLILAELRSALDRQWGSAPYVEYRRENGKSYTYHRGDVIEQEESQTF